MKKGQAGLTLMFFSLVAILVTTGAVMAIISNTIGTSTLEQGTKAYYLAETGAENAILRLLRNPNYSGETIVVDSEGEIQVIISGEGLKTIISEGRTGNLLRKIEVIIDYNDHVLNIVSWKEIS